MSALVDVTAPGHPDSDESSQARVLLWTLVSLRHGLLWPVPFALMLLLSIAHSQEDVVRHQAQEGEGGEPSLSPEAASTLPAMLETGGKITLGAGTFQVNGNIFLTESVGIIIAGSSATILEIQPSQTHDSAIAWLRLLNGHFALRDLTIRAFPPTGRGNAAPEPPAVVMALYSGSVEFERVVIEGYPEISYSGLLNGGDTLGTLVDVLVQGHGKVGVIVHGAANPTLERALVQRNGSVGIGLWGSRGQIVASTIRENGSAGVRNFGHGTRRSARHRSSRTMDTE